MSRLQISNHYTRLLRLWRKDRLRPEERHFQRLLQFRILNAPTSLPAPRDESREINAAYLLLDNSFTQRFPIPKALMEPASDPQHYAKLEQELDEAPERGVWGRFLKKVGGMVRFQ
ncbi:hypothetical protein LTR37_004941 [Vermiconidia calcicola]|uniref:Uncharacterized protein n=1 Tax=Vermiconidia calcicola TaxID=1690605 RepID=A0ACC3NKM9_9PEZI|nr:hypothetical protein LTR37_004941 [Vermiconidia calcicola]